MWFIQCCCDVFVNWESWSSTWRRSKGGGGGGGGEAEQKIPGLKSWVWEKRKRKARKEATVQGYTGRLGWRLRLRHTKRCGIWDCWQSLTRKRQHRWSPGMSKWGEEKHNKQQPGGVWGESGSVRPEQILVQWMEELLPGRSHSPAET